MGENNNDFAFNSTFTNSILFFFQNFSENMNFFAIFWAEILNNFLTVESKSPFLHMKTVFITFESDNFREISILLLQELFSASIANIQKDELLQKRLILPIFETNT